MMMKLAGRITKYHNHQVASLEGPWTVLEPSLSILHPSPFLSPIHIHLVIDRFRLFSGALLATLVLLAIFFYYFAHLSSRFMAKEQK